MEVPIPLTVTLADGKDDRGIRWRHVWGRSGGVPTGGWSAPTTPGGPPRWVHRRPWAVIQILVNFTFLGVDVSVTMLDKFQQSMHAREVGGASDPVPRQIGGYSCWFALALDSAHCAQTGPWSSTGPVPCVFSGALDDEEFFVVEGSGGGGVAGSLDSQVTRHVQNYFSP